MGSFFVLTALRGDSHQLGHHIVVPHSTPSDMLRRRTAENAGEFRAPFACPACGLVSLYSALDLYQFQSDTPSPDIEGASALVYVAAECGTSSCELPTNIHGVWDVRANKFAGDKQPKDWTIDEAVKCKCGSPLKTPLVEYPRYIVAKMPF